MLSIEYTVSSKPQAHPLDKRGCFTQDDAFNDDVKGYPNATNHGADMSYKLIRVICYLQYDQDNHNTFTATLLHCHNTVIYFHVCQQKNDDLSGVIYIPKSNCALINPFDP